MRLGALIAGALVALLALPAAGGAKFSRFRRGDSSAPPLSVNGIACSTGTECASGNCVDSVCCNASCTGSCAACSVAAGASVDGTCAVYADANAGSPSCTPYLCDGSSAACPAACVTSADCAATYACVSNVCVVNYFTSLATSNPATECACSDLAMSGGETVTTTRASVAYCTASTGALVSCANNKPRVSNAGLLVEGARTNILLNSQGLDLWSPYSVGADPVVTANAAVAPDGTTTAESVAFAASSDGSGIVLLYSDAFTGTAAAYSAAMWLKIASGTATTYLTLTDGTTYHTTSCSVTTTWSRCLLQNKTLTATDWFVALGTDTNNNPSHSTTPAQTILAWQGQVELGAFVSSDIATTGTSATRAGESISFVPASSTNTEGCFAATLLNAAPAFPQRITSFNGGNILYNGTASIAINDGTTSVNSPNVSNMTGRTVVGRAQWTGSAMRVDLDGSTGTPGAFDGTMGGATVYLGSNLGNQHMFGHLRAVKLGASSAGCQP